MSLMEVSETRSGATLEVITFVTNKRPKGNIPSHRSQDVTDDFNGEIGHLAIAYMPGRTWHNAGDEPQWLGLRRASTERADNRNCHA